MGELIDSWKAENHKHASLYLFPHGANHGTHTNMLMNIMNEMLSA